MVKVCGIVSVEDARAAIENGANFIGMILWPKSKRSVSRDVARVVAKYCVENGATPVAVFVDETAEEITEICDAIGCDHAQLHGDGAREALETLPTSLGNCRRLRRLGVSANALRSTACLDALGNCIDLESVDASKNRSMCGALPVSWGCLIKLKEINVDETSVDGVPSEIFLSCESLQTLSARRCAALDVAAMKETEGYEHYEARRKGKHDKQLSSRVLMDDARLDERLR